MVEPWRIELQEADECTRVSVLDHSLALVHQSGTGYEQNGAYQQVNQFHSTATVSCHTALLPGYFSDQSNVCCNSTNDVWYFRLHQCLQPEIIFFDAL